MIIILSAQLMPPAFLLLIISLPIMLQIFKLHFVVHIASFVFCLVAFVVPGVMLLLFSMKVKYVELHPAIYYTVFKTLFFKLFFII